MSIPYCECDLDFNCGKHADDEAKWEAHFRLMPPTVYDVENAYDPDDYKGKFWEAWA